MADPIPLSAPDGTVYAWACGTCSRVVQRFPTHPSWKGMPREPRMRAELAEESRQAAVTCCQFCVGRCGARHTLLCNHCRAEAAGAAKALAAIGMAVAVREYGIGCDREATEACDPLVIAIADHTAEPLAALCGVDVETVRRWCRG